MLFCVFVQGSVDSVRDPLSHDTERNFRKTHRNTEAKLALTLSGMGRRLGPARCALAFRGDGTVSNNSDDLACVEAFKKNMRVWGGACVCVYT